MGQEGFEGQTALRGEVTLAEAWGTALTTSLQIRSDGRLAVRDLILTGIWRPVVTEKIFVAIRPGFTIPLGGLAEGLAFTPFSTSSFDPRLSVDAVYGGRFLVVTNAQVRVPLYEGWDGVRQGAFFRSDLRGAYRYNRGVAWLGGSYVGSLKSSVGSQAFGEVAVTAGTLINLEQRVALTVQTRVPVWTSNDRPYDVAFTLGLTVVLGKKEHPEH